MNISSESTVICEKSIIELIMEIRPKVFNMKKNIREFVFKNYKDLTIYQLDDFITLERNKIGGDYFFPNCISQGTIVAHKVCSLNETTKLTGQKLNIDFGLIYKNIIPVDTAITIIFKKNSEEDILEKKIGQCIRSTIRFIDETSKISNLKIAKYVQSYFSSEKYSIASGLCGHTLTPERLHGDTIIPNIYEKDHLVPYKELKIGEFFTIEPFVSIRKKNDNSLVEPVEEDYNEPAECFFLGNYPFSFKVLAIEKNERALLNYKNNLNKEFSESHPIISPNLKEIIQVEQTFFISKQGVIPVSTIFD